MATTKNLLAVNADAPGSSFESNLTSCFTTSTMATVNDGKNQRAGILGGYHLDEQHSPAEYSNIRGTKHWESYAKADSCYSISATQEWDHALGLPHTTALNNECSKKSNLQDSSNGDQNLAISGSRSYVPYTEWKPEATSCNSFWHLLADEQEQIPHEVTSLEQLLAAVEQEPQSIWVDESGRDSNKPRIKGCVGELHGEYMGVNSYSRGWGSSAFPSGSQVANISPYSELSQLTTNQDMSFFGNVTPTFSQDKWLQAIDSGRLIAGMASGWQGPSSGTAQISRRPLQDATAHEFAIPKVNSSDGPEKQLQGGGSQDCQMGTVDSVVNYSNAVKSARQQASVVGPPCRSSTLHILPGMGVSGSGNNAAGPRGQQNFGIIGSGTFTQTREDSSTFTTPSSSNLQGLGKSGPGIILQAQEESSILTTPSTSTLQDLGTSGPCMTFQPGDPSSLTSLSSSSSLQHALALKPFPAPDWLQQATSASNTAPALKVKQPLDLAAQMLNGTGPAPQQGVAFLTHREIIPTSIKSIQSGSIRPDMTKVDITAAEPSRPWLPHPPTPSHIKEAPRKLLGHHYEQQGARETKWPSLEWDTSTGSFILPNHLQFPAGDSQTSFLETSSHGADDVQTKICGDGPKLMTGELRTGDPDQGRRMEFAEMAILLHLAKKKHPACDLDLLESIVSSQAGQNGVHIRPQNTPGTSAATESLDVTDKMVIAKTDPASTGGCSSSYTAQLHNFRQSTDCPVQDPSTDGTTKSMTAVMMEVAGSVSLPPGSMKRLSFGKVQSSGESSEILTSAQETLGVSGDQKGDELAFTSPPTKTSELRRLKRLKSNRESARRTRFKKEQRLHELEIENALLHSDNARLQQELHQANKLAEEASEKIQELEQVVNRVSQDLSLLRPAPDSNEVQNVGGNPTDNCLLLDSSQSSPPTG